MKHQHKLIALAAVALFFGLGRANFALADQQNAGCDAAGTTGGIQNFDGSCTYLNPMVYVDGAWANITPLNDTFAFEGAYGFCAVQGRKFVVDDAILSDASLIQNYGFWPEGPGCVERASLNSKGHVLQVFPYVQGTCATVFVNLVCR